MASYRIWAVSVLTAGCAVSAQPPSQDFNAFRQQMLEGYGNFRRGILEDYSKFLDGVWTDYEAFKAQERDLTPKPPTPPMADPTVERIPWKMKQPVEVVPVPSVPQSPVSKPTPPFTSKKPSIPNAPQTPSVPKRQDTPAISPSTPSQSRPTKAVDFYGVEVEVPAIAVDLPADMSRQASFAEAWRTMEKSDVRTILIPALKSKSAEFSLNDYLTAELVGAVASAFQSGNGALALQHYILANMGYDVRIGLNDSKDAVLLIPFTQEQVYGRAFLKIDGKSYYMFLGKDSAPEAGYAMSVSTCSLPSDADLGRIMDLRINGLTLPEKPREFSMVAAGLEVKGNFNSNIIKMLYHYPQMPMGDYAASVVLPDVRASIVSQLKEQLKDKTELEAVNALLQFMQGSREYATDNAFHGFEKPNFLEETLFFNKCDCEDRAIMYGYLLWEVLGLHSQLLYFPGHESIAVALTEPIKGANYEDQGRTYYVSDPTYMGSVTGMCMPQYKDSAPRIDYTYGR